ncbi:unnamed protein product [Callosobruchus maculatus]|uniref:CHK kinase-like domain-containing protein n=1 Tax=Callosobruchus maculatus TaxID=64391 RepID=A0A653D457_CALMS|nr:unnamed protein product [Callosobruchus maculatus]
MNKDLELWISRAVDKENFKGFEVKIDGQTKKSDGFVGEVIFVTVEGETKDCQTKTLKLALKLSKDGEVLRDDFGEGVFQQEMYTYDEIFPVFEAFQKQKKIQDPFKSYPKCYKCLKIYKKDVIVFENLRAAGYELHDKLKCMNLPHTRTVLKEYAKLHALAFALKDQNPEVFSTLVDGCTDDLFLEYLKKPKFQESIKDSFQQGVNILKKYDDDNLAAKYAKLTTDGVDRLIELFEEKNDQNVINHGDCWNNNFMFQYKDANKDSPSSVMILDWQISNLRSPAFDLAYFLYATSTNYPGTFQNLLKEYHDDLTDFLVQLGSSPDLFTFENLLEHWKKWSYFGVTFVPFVLKFSYASDEVLPDFSASKHEDDISEMMKFAVTDDQLYYKRLKSIIEHYELPS